MMARSRADSGRSQRLPGYVHAVAAGLLLAVVAVYALRAESSSPPAVAEFAPQAQQIKAAPAEQTASFGRGSGGAAGAPAAPSPTPTSLPNDAVYLHCVGDPPRQIEDPQSPPCVPTWAGFNGGATTRGVSSDEIKIAWIEQVIQGQDQSGFYQSILDAYQRFFNSRFELYGRKIRLMLLPESGTSDAQERAEADQVAQQLGAFASMQWEDMGGESYHEELAADHVESAFGWEAAVPESRLQSFAPYLWEYPMAVDTQLRAIGEWYCQRLAGQKASHAGDPLLQSRPRKLGIIWSPNYADSGTPQPIVDELRSCGVTPDVVSSLGNGANGNTFLQFKADGDTSVLVLSETFTYVFSTHDAAAENYFPEWLLATYGSNDTDWGFHFTDPDPEQAAHTFGLTFQPRQEPITDDPAWWAWHEGNPSATTPSDILNIYEMQRFYRSLLLLMSGIQMAGPRLFPAAFESGLQRIQFPNPVTALNAGDVGFPNQAHSMTLDAAEWWYDPAANGPYASYGAGAGTLCYVAGGQRHRLGTWQEVRNRPDPFFSGPCT